MGRVASSAPKTIIGVLLQISSECDIPIVNVTLKRFLVLFVAKHIFSLGRGRVVYIPKLSPISTPGVTHVLDIRPGKVKPSMSYVW